MADDAEKELVATLRAQPADRETRMVYADWLEEHGHADKAAFVRAEEGEAPGPAAGDPRWRAITSRAPIERCTLQFQFQCPKRWDALAPTETDGVRHCASCQQRVYFCMSVEEAHERGSRRECIAIDAAVARGEALSGYDLAGMPHRPIMAGAPMVPDRPMLTGVVSPEPKPGVLSRIGSWFRRR